MSMRNENRPGYKKTKVGWIPAQWECLTIKEVCSQPVSGFSAKGTAEAVSLDDSTIGVLKLSCIMDGYFNPYENKKVVQADIPKVKTPISKDTMLISRSNTEELVGTVCYVEKDYPNLFLSDLMWQVSAKNSEILSIRWLTNLLLTKEYRRKIAARANGTSGSMKKITKGGFLTLPIPLPPFPEQKKIAEILSAWDRAIEQVGKLIDAKQRLKKGLMQQLLTGRMRFPEFGNPVEKKGQLPEGWRKEKLKHILYVRKEKEAESQEYPLYSLTIEDGITPKNERYDRSNLVSNKAQKLYKVVYPSDIVYNPSNLRWGAIGISKEKEPILVSPIYEVLYCKDQHNVWFLFYLLSSPRQIQIFSAYGEGTLIERIAVKINAFLSVPVFLPTLSEQTRIAAVLSTCDREIELLKKKLEKLKEQKKGLMQKLLTGEIRHPFFTCEKECLEGKTNP